MRDRYLYVLRMFNGAKCWDCLTAHSKMQEERATTFCDQNNWKRYDRFPAGPIRGLSALGEEKLRDGLRDPKFKSTISAYDRIKMLRLDR
jgi:hypothetical protein